MKIIAGVDEVGRGCLAGPVVSAAVILKKGAKLKGIKDSKKLSFLQRKKMSNEIQKNSYFSYGIASVKDIKVHLKKTDGVMIGRAAYHTPYFLAEIENKIFNNQNVPTRQEVIEKLIPYIKEEVKKGTRLNQIMRHTLGLFHGQTGASYWKRYLSENMCVRNADVQKIDHIMDKINYNNIESRVG